MTIQTRLIFGYVLIAALLAGGAYRGGKSMRQLALDAERVSTFTVQEVEALDDLRAAGLTATARARSILLILAGAETVATAELGAARAELATAQDGHAAALARCAQVLEIALPEVSRYHERIRVSAGWLQEVLALVLAETMPRSPAIARLARLLDARERDFLDTLAGALALERGEMHERQGALARDLDRIYRDGAIFQVLIFALAISIGVLTGRSLVRPVRRLAEAVQGYAAGRWDTPVPTDAPGELGALARHVNRMAGELDRSFAALEERTAALAASNQALEAAALRAEAATRAKSEFLANMSHEIRTPLKSPSTNSPLSRLNCIRYHDLMCRAF